ncbi:hypothetical protein SCUP234_12779 [Seiridium cupressi]
MGNIIIDALHASPDSGIRFGSERDDSTQKFVVLLSTIFALVVLVLIFWSVYEWFSGGRLGDSDDQEVRIPDDQQDDQQDDQPHGHIDNYGYYVQPVDSRAPFYNYQGYDGVGAINQM